MASSKKAFGQFVTIKRKAAGLTQSALAERLYVSESAVSKWERGVSYPDISLVGPLASHLGVSEGELLKASDDVVAARQSREARSYRRWRTSILWTSGIAYSLGLLTCLIVDLTVDPGLSWFWVVFSSVVVAFSVTTLPLLLVRRRAMTVLGVFLVGLFATFTVAGAPYGGGAWVPSAVAAVLLAVVVVLGPVALRAWPLPAPYARHRLVVALVLDTLAIAGFLFVVTVATDRLDTWWSHTVPVAALVVAAVWVVSLVLRYLPMSRLGRGAVVAALSGGFVWVLGSVVGRITDEPARRVDLASWNEAHIDGNVSFLVLVGCLLIAAALAVAAVGKARQEHEPGAGRPAQGGPGRRGLIDEQ